MEDHEEEEVTSLLQQSTIDGGVGDSKAEVKQSVEVSQVSQAAAGITNIPPNSQAGVAGELMSEPEPDSDKDEVTKLKDELMEARAQLARVTKERDYYKRKALWLRSEDQRILSDVIVSTDHWYERTWLMVHEPIRIALVDIEDLVIKSPSFDPVLYPFKVTNFFIFFNKCLAPYVRRHHEAEEKVYFPWIQTKVQIPAALLDEHTSNQCVGNLLKDIEGCEAEYKRLTTNRSPSAPELYDWRSRLITTLQVLVDGLRTHMAQEEGFFPAVVKDHFTKAEEDAIVEKMGSVHTAHIELPMVLMGIDNWGGPAIKEEFLQRLSKIAKYTLNQYWIPTFKKTCYGMLESLALETPPPPTYVPLLSAPMLIASSPVLLLCTIQ